MLPLLIFASAALSAGCRRADAATETRARTDASAPAPAVAVRAEPISRGKAVHRVRGAGTVRSKTEVDLSFKVPGIVAEVLVDEGAKVKKGQLLARLDPTEVGASLRQAEEGVFKAERDLARVTRLHETGALPVAQQDDAETGVRLARAAKDAAAFSMQRAALLSPDDGRVDRRMLEKGEVVTPGRPVFHISGRSRGTVVRIGLTDRDVLRIREGDAATATVDAMPDAPIAGKVSQIATVATPGVGTFEVEILLGEDAKTLLSGLTAKVEIAHAEPDLVTVPTAAIFDGRGDRAAVYVIDGDRVRRKAVRVAFFTGTSVALSTPLDGAAEVISAGLDDLEDGAPVHVLR